MQKKLNLKVKYRESFRPFAPAVLEEEASEYFEMDSPTPYMLVVTNVKEELRKPSSLKKSEGLRQRLYEERSPFPAITHLDYSARVQTVNKEDSPEFYSLLQAFKDRTGHGMVVNTSFNVRGEPIVCSPEDAYRCFMRTEMDALVMGHFVFEKDNQQAWEESDEWKKEFPLD